MMSMSAVALWSIFITIQIMINDAAFTALKWNKRLEDFVPISDGVTYEIEKRRMALQSRQGEMHNFNGRRLNFTYYEEDGLFNFYDNDTKVTGAIGDMWNILSELLNFTLVASKSHENTVGRSCIGGNFDGILESARLNQTDVIPKLETSVLRHRAVDFTPSIWINWQTIFVHEHWKQNPAWMFNTFSLEVWCFIMIFIAIIGLLSAVTQRVLMRHGDRDDYHRSYFDHLFYTYATVCNQSNSSNDTRIGSRTLALVISIFGWLVLIGYSSRLTSTMTSADISDPPFNDLSTLMTNTKLNLVVFNGSVGHIMLFNPVSPFTKLYGAKRVTVVSDVTELYRKVCFDSNEYVLFGGKDELSARILPPACNLRPVGIDNFRLPIVSGIARSVEHKRSFDIGIMKLREFGIIDALKRRYLPSRTGQSEVKKPGSLAIDIQRVFPIFQLLCGGIIASIIILAAENIIFASKKCKCQPNLRCNG